MSEPLRHALLERAELDHGFGMRDTPPPSDVVRPNQVHGVTVARVVDGAARPADADAIVTSTSGVCVAVITADCVPILVSSEDGRAVGAIHAGWRGLAAGVVERGVAAVREACGAGVSLVAVIGPHIGACCYEVDAPVIDGCRARFAGETSAALSPVAAKPGHAMLDLAALVEMDLARSGVARSRIARLEIDGRTACTRCDAARFHSYRRDGERAGRLLHFIRASDAVR